MTLVIQDLSSSPEDVDRLARFYDELYVASFPDANERESLANMKRYLELKSQGWYGRNCYHIMLGLEADKVVAASVSDYLAKPNCGVIEFILVGQLSQGRGNGKTMHAATIAALTADARRAGRDDIDGIVIELNDPFQVAPQNDNYDPFERAMIWSGWGYGRLCFPYVQPALSSEQEPVTCLLLAIKPIAAQLQHEVPSAQVRDIVHEYLRWAMRIKRPARDPTFAAMKRFLSTRATIDVEPLSIYVGRDPDKPLAIRPIKEVGDPSFKIATDIYARAFPPGPTVIDVRMFEHALQWSVGQKNMHYHLWALSDRPDGPIAGMASFFVFPRFGFGGYAALEPPLKGTGRIRMIIKRAEEQAIREEANAKDYYIECVPNSPQEAIFRKIDFEPVPVRYCQPPTADDEKFGNGTGPELTLLRKRLGCDYGRTPFSADDFLEDLKVWLAAVYRLSDPEASHTFQIARSTVARLRLRGARGGSGWTRFFGRRKSS
jgi:hypothetical protein